MAEGEGFEPPLPVRVKRFSRPPVSTAHTSLREWQVHIHHSDAAGQSKRECCRRPRKGNARRTAERLHIAVTIFNYETEFAAPR
jgi:hypothetical protein